MFCLGIDCRLQQPWSFDVPILTSTEIIAAFRPPYDLLKVHIEGAEFELLRDYHQLVSHCECLLLEWHSRHPDGGLERLRELSSDVGLTQLAELLPVRKVAAGETGVLLFRRTQCDEVVDVR